MALKDLSETAASNTSISGVGVGENTTPRSNLNHADRSLAALIRQATASAGASVASAAVPDIVTPDGNFITLTGQSTINAFAAGSPGLIKYLQASSALTLTASASVLLPGSTNLSLGANDIVGIRYESSTITRLLSYQPAAGVGIVTGPISNSGLTMPPSVLLGRITDGTGAVEPIRIGSVLEMLASTINVRVATQSILEAGASAVDVVTPARQQYHPSACKAWVEATFAGGSAAAYNVSSVSDVNTGIVGPNWDIDFSSSAYFADACPKIDPSGAASGTITGMIRDTSFASSGCRADSVRVSDGTSVDVTHLMVAAFGDQ
jgi:hypothetical protein